MTRQELEKAMHESTWLAWSRIGRISILVTVVRVYAPQQHGCRVKGPGWYQDVPHFQLRVATPQDMLRLE